MPPSRQRKFAAFETVMKWFASGPSANTTGAYMSRSVKTGPYSSWRRSRSGSGLRSNSRVRRMLNDCSPGGN